MGRKLYVGNLPYSAAEQDLQELFERVGPVESVTVMRDKKPLTLTGKADAGRPRRTAHAII